MSAGMSPADVAASLPPLTDAQVQSVAMLLTAPAGLEVTR